MLIKKIHHIAIICSDLEKSKNFYIDVLGFKIINEVYRSDTDSYKIDLALSQVYLIELFSFPKAPKRLSYPEACGLRHLAFEVEDINQWQKFLLLKNINTTEIRIDPYTAKKFFFFFDPDDLPIEFYEN